MSEISDSAISSLKNFTDNAAWHLHEVVREIQRGNTALACQEYLRAKAHFGYIEPLLHGLNDPTESEETP